MIVTESNVVVENQVGLPLAQYCIVMVNGWKVYGQELTEDVYGYTLKDHLRNVFVPVQRSKAYRVR
jgi:hypothetical protein